MNGLTTREASRIEEGLHLEEALVAKFGVLANQATDPDCRRVLSDVQAMHRRHYDVLRHQVDTAIRRHGATSSGVTQGQSGTGHSMPERS